MTDVFITALRRINKGIALLVGLVLACSVVLIILDICLREMGVSFGGAEEISGYVMAGVTSWGASYTLTELAHVRIDLVRMRLKSRGQALLDLLSIVLLAGTAIVIAFECWPVLEKTISRGSHANTPLETPLWIPQVFWFSGWLWFAICSSFLVLLALVLLAKGDLKKADALVGARSELELEQ